MAGLYIHIPFCRSKCAYCDFYSAPLDQPEIVDNYISGIINELSLRKEEIEEPMRTIYIGGGTPSLLSASQLTRLFDAIKDEINFSSIEEITIEANPEDITKEKIDFFQSLEINRVSIGIQSFDPEALKAVERKHTARMSRRALEALSSSGMNYSADLIYGLPYQSLSHWENNLKELLSYRPPHISAYLLSYEPGTRLYARMIAGKIQEASEQLVRTQYDILCNITKNADYQHYEIANFSLPGKHSRHNSAYWEFRPYLGLGAGAHSFNGSARRYNPCSYKKYIESLLNGNICYIEEERGEYDLFNETLLTSLRTSAGLDVNRAASLLRDHKDREQFLNQISALADTNKIRQIGNDCFVIDEGEWLRADAIIRDLFLTD